MKRPPSPTRLMLNLAPMVDVMMCLLIFFMLATKLVERENSRIDLPMAQAAMDAEKQALGNRFVVNIRAGSSAEPERVIYLVREEALPLERVADRLRQEQEHDPGVNCVIRADRQLPYRHVQALMAACLEAKITNITLGAVRVEGRGAE